MILQKTPLLDWHGVQELTREPSCTCDWCEEDDGQTWTHSPNRPRGYGVLKLRKRLFEPDPVRHYFSVIHNGNSYVQLRIREAFQGMINRPEFTNVQGDSVCNDCEEHTFVCDDCDERFHNDDSNRVYSDNGPRTVCDGCRESYIYCEFCHEYNHEEDTYWTDHERAICNGCVSDCETICCENCDMYVEDSDGYCNSCGHCNGDSHLIKSYDYRPNFQFFGKATKTNPFIGFEIEIESTANKTDLAETCAAHFEDCYLKHDGSLNDGFEVVSMPKTIQEHYKAGYHVAMKKAIEDGGRSHNTSSCGIHFHLDNSNMSDAHKVRFGMFFAVCRAPLEVFARRSSDRWCAFKDKGLRYREYAQSEGRYEAVNWENRNTVEVRIFKGTLKYSTFIASMELCHAVYNFTREKQAFSSRLDDLIVFKRFFKWVKKRSDRYSHLIKYIESKEYFQNELEETKES